jgi:hypothetical protein
VEEFQILAEIELGDAVSAFLKTPVGQYLDGCSQQDIDSAKDELLKLDPFSEDVSKRIASIQLKAKAAQLIRSYLSEAIIKGQQAQHQIDEVED